MAKKKNNRHFYWILFGLILIAAIIYATDYFSQNDTTEDLTIKTSDIKTEITLEPEIESSSEKTSENLVKKIQLLQNIEIPLCQASINGEAKDHQIRRFQNYVLCYRESYEQPEWVAYCLEKSELQKTAARKNDFRPDPEIKTGSASLSDYKKSGYDRGHLAPAADFSFSEDAMSESFFMSNMSPQAPGFNREIWQYLEGQVRIWAENFNRIYVVTGPVLEKPADQYLSIGQNQVSVPEYYYKALLAPVYTDESDLNSPDDCSSVQALGFILPNEKCNDTFWDYAVTIDEVEKRTGLDFFSLLENILENKIESEIDINNWK